MAKKNHKTSPPSRPRPKPLPRKSPGTKPSAPPPLLKPDSVGLEKYLGNWAWVLVAGLMLVVGFFAFKDFILLKYLYYFKDIGSDTVNVDYPAYVMQQELARQDRVVRWSFYAGMGQNCFAQVPLYVDPVYWFGQLNLLWQKALYGNDWGILARFVGKYMRFVLTGLLFFGYLRTLRIDRYTAMIGALMMGFSGFLVLGSSWDHGFYIFNGVALLFAFEQLYQKRRWYFFPIAVMYFARNLFGLYLFGAFLVLYVIFRLLAEGDFKARTLFRLTWQMAALSVFGLTMASANMVNSFLIMYNSPRVSGSAQLGEQLSQPGIFALDRSIENFGVEGLHYITAVLRLFSNDIMGNGSDFKGWFNYLEAPAFYCGLLAILLVPQVFLFLTPRKKLIYGGFLFIWCFMVIFPWMRHAFHLFIGNYYRVGFNFFVVATLLFFSLHALSNILTNRRLSISLLLVTLFVCLILLYVNYPSNPYFPARNNPIDYAVRFLVTAFLILIAGALVMIARARNRIVWQVVLLVLVATEAGVMAHHTVNKRDAYTRREFLAQAGGFNDETMDALRYIRQHDSSFHRVFKEYSSGTSQHGSLNDAQAQLFYGTPSYNSFNQPFYIRFLEETGIIQKGVETSTRWAPGLGFRPLLHSVFSVKYNLTREDSSYFLLRGYRKIAQVEGVHVLKNDFVLPLGFTYTNYMRLDEFRKLSPFQKDAAFLRAAIIENDESPENLKIRTNLREITATDTLPTFDLAMYRALTDSLAIDTLAIQTHSQNNISGTIDMNRSGILFFSIPYDRGWRLRVDGKETPLQLTNIGFSGVFLEKGKHSIELEFWPLYFHETVRITYAAQIVFMLLVALTNFKALRKLIGRRTQIIRTELLQSGTNNE